MFRIIQKYSVLHLVSCVRLFVTPCTSSQQASVNMGVTHTRILQLVAMPKGWQGIFPTQGSNPGLLHAGRFFYHLSHHRSPRILEWVATLHSPGDLPNHGIKTVSSGFLPAELPGKSRETVVLLKVTDLPNDCNDKSYLLLAVFHHHSSLKR